MFAEGWENLYHILAIQLDETVATVMPALQTLHQALPNAKITLMTAATNQPFLPGAEDVLVCDPAWQSLSFENLDPALVQALIAQIHSYQFDAAVIFNKAFQSPYPLAYICYLAGIPIRLGQSKEFGGSVLSHWVKSASDQTDPNHHLFLLESAGLVPREHHSRNTVVPSSDAARRRP